MSALPNITRRKPAAASASFSHRLRLPTSSSGSWSGRYVIHNGITFAITSCLSERAFASFLINFLCAANFAFWTARAHFGQANDLHRRLGLQLSSLSASPLYAWASFFEPAAALLAAR